MNKANFTADTIGESNTGPNFILSLSSNKTVVFGGLIVVLVVDDVLLK